MKSADQLNQESHRMEISKDHLPDRMQKERRELKYFTTPEQAQEIQIFVASRLPLDEYSVGRPNFRYDIHSLYWEDERCWPVWWDNEQGLKNRYKLRLRWYDDKPESPVFVEIKSRMNGVIHKKRAAVTRGGAFQLMGGQTPDAEKVMSDNKIKAEEAILSFLRRAEVKKIHPAVRVSYQREAYVSDDDQQRVTFDRNVVGALETSSRLLTTIENPIPIWGPQVVLELKFTGRFPNWYKTIVQSFNLVASAAPKFADTACAIRGSDYYPDRIWRWRRSGQSYFPPKEFLLDWAAQSVATMPPSYL